MERHMRKTLPRSEDIYTSDVFEILFGYEVTRSKRYPSPLALLHIEMDPIALNADLLAAAPAVFAAALNSHLRSVDIPSTYGKSFRVLLPSSNEHGARAVCERLLSVYRNKFDVPNGSTASIPPTSGMRAIPSMTTTQPLPSTGRNFFLEQGTK